MTMTAMTYHQGTDEADLDREMEEIISRAVHGASLPADRARFEELLARREAMLSPPAIRRVAAAATAMRKYA